MPSKKRIYEKPKVRTVKMLEVGAAVCCRATLATCLNAARQAKGGQRTLTSS